MITKLIVNITHFDLTPEAIKKQLEESILHGISTTFLVTPYIEPKPQVPESIMQLIKEAILEDENLIDKIVNECTDKACENNALINISFP